MNPVQGVYKFNQANFQENPGGIIRKIQDMFALLRPPSEGTPRAEIPILWVFQLSVSPPQPNRNLGERHRLPHRGPWQSPGWKRVLVHLEVEGTHLVAINFVFLWGIFIHILWLETNVVNFRHLAQKFPGGPINFQEISRRVFKFQEISSFSRSCRHPAVESSNV